MHQFEGRVAEKDTRMWSVYIDVPMDIVTALKKAKTSRLIVTFNGQVPNHCALMPSGDGRYFLLINKERLKKLGLTIGSALQVEIKPDNSEYGMPMPEEMEELMKQDEDAHRYFHLLSPGKQRSLLYIIGKPKGSETRLRKAIATCEYLKSVEGRLDFKELNEAIKSNRFTL